MSTKELLAGDSFWMQDGNTPIVLSTRIRLARNLANIAFPQDMKEDEARRVEERITAPLKDFSHNGEGLSYLALNDLSDIEKRVLTEKHLISPALAELSSAGGVAISDSHKVSVMVNEEDHLRIQVLMPGNRLDKAQGLANLIDDYLEEHLDIAYNSKFGYLTSCPTNAGTGLRISVMVHLPALVITNQIQKVLGALAPLGLTVRGLYGEGSKAFGNIFQISNQITLGKSEEDTLAHLNAVTHQLVEHELKARDALKSEAALIMEDKVWRARGILQNARLLTSEETFSLLSEDHLGVEMGILPKIEPSFISLLINSLQGCLQYKTRRALDGNLLNYERANFLRQAFASASEISE